MQTDTECLCGADLEPWSLVLLQDTLTHGLARKEPILRHSDQRSTALPLHSNITFADVGSIISTAQMTHCSCLQSSKIKQRLPWIGNSSLGITSRLRDLFFVFCLWKLEAKSPLFGKNLDLFYLDPIITLFSTCYYVDA